jgi:hypothetical protein
MLWWYPENVRMEDGKSVLGIFLADSLGFDKKEGFRMP